MSFPIDDTIPAAANDPADDQPLMKTNFGNIKSYLNVDHVLAGVSGNGRHKQVTYNSKNVPGVQVDPVTVAYTDSGIADPTHPQHFWRNSQGIFPLSAVRAIARISGNIGGASVTYSAKFNFTTVTIAGRIVTATTVANSTFGNNAVVLITLDNGNVPSYNLTAGVLTFSVPGTFTGNFVAHVIVLQV